MDYLYEDDEIICKINNFEMLSDKNIKKISKDRRVLLYSSKSGKMFKVLVFILMFIYFIIISSKLTINESNLFKLLYFILSITFPIFLICFRKYLFENNLLIININSIMPILLYRKHIHMLQPDIGLLGPISRKQLIIL